MRYKTLVFSVAAALTMVASTVGAAPLDSYDVVVEDPEGDAMNYLAPGVHVSELPGGVTRLSTEKQDITLLSMGVADGVLHVKLNTMAGYMGSSSLLYVVHFTSGGTPYYTCWNIQSVGTTAQYQNVNENFDLGCTKFSSDGAETRVGPTTRANGVDVVTSGDDIHVRWEVPLSSIGDPAVGDTLGEVWAETWNRGLNIASFPSTAPQSAYVWNLADRAPDEGVAEYVLGGAAPAGFNLTLTAEPANQTAAPGQVVQYAIGLAAAGNGTGNASLAVEGLPEGFTAAFDASEVVLNGTTEATVTLNVTVPASAVNGTHAFTVNATGPGDASASIGLGLLVEVPEAAGPADTELGGNATGDGAETAEGGGIPSVGAMVSAFVVLGAVVIVRRRRGTNL